MSNQFPFVYVNHGGYTSIDAIGKSEELYLWFARQVKPRERASIEKKCPKPIAGFFEWESEFVCFGSQGDSFDVDIVQHYATKAERERLDRDEDFRQDLVARYADVFTHDLEQWICGIHQWIPVAFFIGPNAFGGTNWAQWSSEQVPVVAVPKLYQFIAKNPDIELEDESPICIILDSLLEQVHPKTDEECAKLLQLLVKYHTACGEQGNLSTLSEQNAHLLAKAFSVRPKEVLHQLAACPASLQLQYLASAYAIKSGVWNTLEKPLLHIQQLLKKVPQKGQKGVAELLIQMAQYLAQSSLGNQVSLALNVMHLAAKSVDATEQNYLQMASFYDRLKAYQPMLLCALQADKKFPNRSDILANILYAADKTGNHELESQYTQKSLLANLHDSNLLVNQLHNLIANQKQAEAKQLFKQYLAQGNRPSPPILHNTLCAYLSDSFGQEEFIRYVLSFYLKKGRNDIKAYAPLTKNMGYLLNTLKRYAESADVFRIFKKAGGSMSPTLYLTHTFTLLHLGNVEQQKSVLEEIEGLLAQQPTYLSTEPTCLYNIAALYVAVGNLKKAIYFAALCKKYCFTEFQKMRTDTCFKPIWKDPGFKMLMKS